MKYIGKIDKKTGEKIEDLKVRGRQFLGNVYQRGVSICKAEEGITVVEIILVLVVLIGLVLIFKSQLTSIINDIFETITSESSTV